MRFLIWTKGTPLEELICSLVTSIDYETHLQKTETDWVKRLLNVESLIRYAKEFEIEFNRKPGFSSGTISR